MKLKITFLKFLRPQHVPEANEIMWMAKQMNADVFYIIVIPS